MSEREFEADIIIWPIQFTVASNDLGEMYQLIDTSTDKIRVFLEKASINADEISYLPPIITDKSAQQYGSQQRAEYRYTVEQTVTVYSTDIMTVRKVMKNMSDLGKQGIALSGDNYQSQTEYLFTRLNEVKPEMIEEATRAAREVAEKFAADSKSTLGKSGQPHRASLVSANVTKTIHILRKFGWCRRLLTIYLIDCHRFQKGHD